MEGLIDRWENWAAKSKWRTRAYIFAIYFVAGVVIGVFALAFLILLSLGFAID